MAKTIHEQIEELQALICAYQDEGDYQEAYWVEQDLQYLFEMQEMQERSHTL